VSYDRIKNPSAENLAIKHQLRPRAARITVGGLESMEAVAASSGNIEYSEMLLPKDVFVDASEHAYSAACYLQVSQKDEVDVMLVVAKSKVAPLKPLSIPRMELVLPICGKERILDNFPVKRSEAETKMCI